MFTIESSLLHHEQFNVFAKQLALYLLPGDTVLLQGGLGAGKTTFVQQAALSLEVSDDQYVSSPSYGLLHEYQGKLTVYHMDLYRLEGEDDVEAAGLFDYFTHSGVSFIEWPERLEASLPAEYLWITIAIAGTDIRKFSLKLHGQSWLKRSEPLRKILSPAT